MFYANNEQVKGIFLNGRNYNYLAYGFGKIIPEDRNAEQLNLNLAYKYLNQYRIEWGTVKDGYENALVSPRFDKPDNGIFHTPFTYYYGGNIISTKEVNVLVNNAHWALLNATVYNDMNINGNITYFATNTDFLGHNVNVFPEGENEPIYKARLSQPILGNCTNFSFDIKTRFSKDEYPSVGDCNNFSGNFRYVGSVDNQYLGFMGFLYRCKDGVFNIDCTNMHGGGSNANVTNYYNFSCIQDCNNMKINITGSSWQVWPHNQSFSRNCNINTYNVISGFSYMNDCNFNVMLPKDSKPEMDKPFTFLNNAENCNYNLYATDVNLFNYRSGVSYTAFFDDLNNCNLNLLVNNTVSFDHTLGSKLNNCNIVFDNLKTSLAFSGGLMYLNNCNITGNIVNSAYADGAFIYNSNNINVNLNLAGTALSTVLYGCRNVRGNLVADDKTFISYSTYLNLDVSKGNLNLTNVEHGLFYSNGTNFNTVNVNNCKFEIYNSNDFVAHGASNCNFNMRNSVGNAVLSNLNNVDFVVRGGANYTIYGFDDCYNSWIYANTVIGWINNINNTRIEFQNNGPRFGLKNVRYSQITGFPFIVYYTTNCTFHASIPEAVFRNSSYVTWNNVWPHATRRGGDGWNTLYRTKAGLRSVDNFSSCYLNCNDGSAVYDSKYFDNANNMQTDIRDFWETVTANLPIYNMNIKFNVDCKTLNLGIFQAGPPHGFQNATISANNIYGKNHPEYYIQANCDTRIYCENYCNVCFYPYVSNYNSVLQPVILINNYQHSNSIACNFYGGLTRIGRLNYRGGMPADLNLRAGAIVFINNALLGNVNVVDNSLLFLGSNYDWTGTVTVTNGGRIRTAADLTNDDINFINRGQLCWNLWDSGPWGSQSLLNFCKNV